MIRVAMLSYWHVHAWDYTRQVQAHPDTEVAAVWDEIPERGRAAAEKLGVPFYESLDAVLAQPDIQAVVVDAPTNIHREVMVAAAKAGKHIFTEKVVAATLADFNQIQAAVDQAGVKLTVSLPRLYNGYTLAIKALLDGGALGDVVLVRTRLAHNGSLPNESSASGWLPAHFYSLEQTGGGALIDLGCHPMYLARLFMGEVDTVSARYGYVTGREVEDNAVATLTGAKGALAVVEAGFSSSVGTFSIEIHGTKGALMYGTPDARLLYQAAGARGPWEEKPIPADEPMAFDQWVGHIQGGTSATANVAAARDLTRLMEAANLSAASGQAVKLSDLKA